MYNHNDNGWYTVIPAHSCCLLPYFGIVTKSDTHYYGLFFKLMQTQKWDHSLVFKSQSNVLLFKNWYKLLQLKPRKADESGIIYPYICKPRNLISFWKTSWAALSSDCLATDSTQVPDYLSMDWRFFLLQEL